MGSGPDQIFEEQSFACINEKKSAKGIHDQIIA